MEPVAERAWREMSERYGYAPAEPLRVEVYPRHADFSVRTVGLVGIGALGVSFGPALAMDSPTARDRGDFNWASTLWHEIAHSFHIGVSDSNVPRWFSEGLAVHEQRKADSGWGHQAGVSFVRSLASGDLRPVSELDRGFSSPRHPGEVRDSYYQASLVFEVIEDRYGFPAIVEMLHAYRDGANNAEAFERALGVDLDDFDRDFEAFLKGRFAAAIASVGAGEAGTSNAPVPAGMPDIVRDIATLKAEVARNPGRFVPRMALGQALFRDGRRAEAAEHFEAALELFPRYGGPGGAHWFLGRIREEEGDTAAAVAHYRAFLALNESHYDARVRAGSAARRRRGRGGGRRGPARARPHPPLRDREPRALGRPAGGAGRPRRRGRGAARGPRAASRGPGRRPLPARTRPAPQGGPDGGAQRGPRGTGTGPQLRRGARPAPRVAAGRVGLVNCFT